MFGAYARFTLTRSGKRTTVAVNSDRAGLKALLVQLLWYQKSTMLAAVCT